MAGTIKGECHFFDVGVETGLRRREDSEGGKLEVRSKMGKNARGSRVNGIVSIQDGSSQHNSHLKLLISSADSRIRLYNFKDKSLEAKFKGHEAEELPIRAMASDDGRYVVSGSEDRGCYIWSLSMQEQNKDKPAQHPLEYFDASSAKTTAAILAPKRTRELLAKSEDPIYDLCNPPPVTLMSRSESLNSSHGATETGSITSTPNLKGNGGSSGQTPTSTPKATPTANDHSRSNTSKKALETPAYQARCAHPDGNIIVTASSNGSIRVYRQDCAFSKRQRLQSSDTWETSSMFAHHGKRPSSFYMAQAMSPHLRGSSGGNFQGRRKTRSDSQASNGTQPPGERILSWRQGVSSSTPSLNMEKSATIWE
jgi:WD40 repeat protein